MSFLLYRKRKGKHIIQNQTELLEEARADLFGQVLERPYKRNIKSEKRMHKNLLSGMTRVKQRTSHFQFKMGRNLQH